MPQYIYFLNILWDIIDKWWWILMPLILYRPFLFFWLYWRKERWMLAQKSVLLEIKMPKEVLKPLRSMEQVFSAIWGSIFDPADWWENWIEGKALLSVQLELVSLEGEAHFFIRCHESRKNAVEAAIYSQYPEAEISLVDDYTKYVPQDLPNKDWDMWGSDYELVKPDVYPIKTYSKFFEERPEVAKEEKRVDPMSTLLEGMGTMGPGEQLWIQIAFKPGISSDNSAEGFYDFVKKGREIADKLAKRPEKKAASHRPIVQEAVEELLAGQMPTTEEPKEELSIESMYPPELRLTPGERDILAGVEEKISKRCNECYIRFIYLAKKDAYFGGAKAIPFGYFAQFSTENLNQPKPWTRTITKIHRYPILDLFRARRLYIRKRRLFFRYLMRFPPVYPLSGGTFLLNTEELATIFHFPGRAAAGAPFVPRVEAKTGEAPPGLPTEK